MSAAVLAGIILLVLDLARAYVGPALRPAQYVAALFALWALWRLLAARGQGFREALPVLALAAALVPTYVDHARVLQSDGIHYYSYLRSLLFDHDLDLANDYALLGYEQRGPNVLPVGAALFWAVLVVPLHLLREAARLFGLGAPTGVEPLYQSAACLATFAYGAAGLQLLQLTLRRWVSPAVAFWTTLGCWLGSPLRFYLSVLPGLAHGVEFFAAVLVLRTALALRDRPATRPAVLAGVACGLVFLARSQDGLLLGLAGVFLVEQLIAESDRRRTLQLVGVMLAAFAVTALPQIAVWQSMFGVPLLVPHKLLHGAAFMHATEPQLLGTLLSPRGGLFLNYPLTLVAAAGLVGLVRRDPRYVLAALPVLLAGWYVNATVFDWYQVRRFTGLVPLLAPGLALAFVPLARASAVLAAIVFFAFRYDLAVDAGRDLPGQPVPARAALSEMADGLAADGYGLLQPVAPRAAVRLLASYTGERLGEDGMSEVALGGSTSLMRLPQKARNLSGVEAEAGETCRWVTAREARVFLPLAVQGRLVLKLRARPLEAEPTQVMDVLWNEEPLTQVSMQGEWTDYRLDVPAARVRPGTNVLALSFARTPIFHRVRGTGPHQVRPAALASLTVHVLAEP